MNLPDIVTSSIATEDWQPFIAGEIHMLREDGEGKLSTGLWRVTPEQASKNALVPCHQDETVYIIHGHITVKNSDGEVHDLKAGSFASFRKGSVNTWSVHEPTLEFFVYS
ncbi:MAG: cupin domain-containing protein [Alphaproteobacteria bacterium]|nr:cupin domain-containing protein [Alphaproteobacteria bacterium]MBU0794974.1 cupin domain-containing protein [Alphaproteobacteria bacterium]MBU0876632.1 cupin domain-containing protein [Alphaproteobacteria bacterium]MBU1769334.1 cupin domain-containing protein [Alphaproteobacteria bacterium]